jgi:hypothetical protein
MSCLGVGTSADIIKGIGWVLDDASAKDVIADSVMVMALGGDCVETYYTAIALAFDTGIPVRAAH